MAHTVVRDYELTHSATHVENGTIIPTDADAYPSGWNYSLHYGEIGGQTLFRFDNAHEEEEGHERHTPDAVETIVIASITPNLNDLFVDATVTATVQLDDADEAGAAAVRSALLDGFGIARVEVVSIEDLEAGSQG